METQDIVIGVIVGVLISALSIYSVNSQQMNQLNTRIDELKNDDNIHELRSQIEACANDYDELESSINDLNDTLNAERKAKNELAQLQLENNSMDEDFSLLQSTYDELEYSTNLLNEEYLNLQSECEMHDDLQEVNSTYHDLIETLYLLDAKNQTQVLEYSQASGTDVIYSFDMPYNITLEIEIDYSGNYISIALSWRKGELAGSIGSSGRAVSESKPALEGMIRATYLDADASSIWIRGAITTNYPYVQRSGEVRLGVP